MNPEKSKRVHDALFGARAFYAIFSIITLTIFGLYDNQFKDAFIQHKYLYLGFFFGLLAISIRYYLTCGQNPGYLDMNETKIRELDNKITDENEKETKISINSGSKPNLVAASEDNEVEIKENPSTEAANTEPNNSDPRPPKRFCERCQITQEYRSRHCHLCGRCVRKFDHHCFWVGGCIGEFNHGNFTNFLVFQTIMQFWLIYICADGTDRAQIMRSKEFGAFCVLGLAHLAFLGFVGSLAVFHVFLVCSGQTTWEFIRKDKLDYLKIYPKGFSPFDLGLWKNLKSVYFHRNIPRDWTLPDVELARENQRFNWCENEYWSCC